MKSWFLFASCMLAGWLLACEPPPPDAAPPAPEAAAPDESKAASTPERPVDSEKTGDNKTPAPDRAKSEASNAPQGRKVCMHLKLQGEMQEVRNESPFVHRQMVLPQLLKQLRDFAADGQVGAVFLEDRGLSAPLASLWEIRQALLELKKGGKQVLYYSDAYDTRNYYLASAANAIILHEAGAWEVTGIAMEFTFLRDTLAMLGIQADFLQVGKYKGAAENLTRNAMSPELRASLTELLDSLYATWTNEVAAARGMAPAALQALVDEGFLAPEAALRQRIVDRVADAGQELEALRKTFEVRVPDPPKKPTPNLFEMLNPKPAEKEPDYPHIALVIASGPILYASEEMDWLGEERVVDAQKWLKTLERIRKNPHVRGILLRIDSPGGSALASDLLWNAIRAAAGDRPLVASMGPTAASGGYYVASAAPLIFASPFTLTGSIGVVGGKLVFQDTLSKVKAGTEILSRGRNAAYLSSARPFSPSERAMIARSMERTYQLFLQRIRATRPQVKNLEEIAQGRIWSGTDAQKNGLVDRLGGVQDAAAALKELARLPDDTPVLIYPRPKPWLLQLQELLDPDAAAQAMLHGALGPWRLRFWNFAYILRLFSREHVQTVTPVAFEAP